MRTLPIILTALLIVLLIAPVPTVQADGLHQANVFLDVWKIDNNTWVNVTAHLTQSDPLHGCSASLHLFGKNASGSPVSIFFQSMNKIQSPHPQGGEVFSRNRTVNTHYDSLSVTVIWTTGVGCATAHRDAQTFRSGDFYVENADQCPEGGCVSNSWFNNSFVVAPVLGNLTADDFTVLGSIDITTAFDSWIPLLIYGGLSLLFLYYVAWLPAVSAIMSLLNALLPTPIWGTPGSLMLIFLALMVHAIATQGFLRSGWGRNP